ncbi:MAG: GNAT family N-acetyltransferase [Candidatus Limnocylindrales bacterium]
MTQADRPGLADFMANHWGTTQMAAHGQLVAVPDLPGFVAERDAEWLGHVAYMVEGPMLEIVWVGTAAEREGTGSALIAECVNVARERNLTRVWLVTTNDNLDALRFYQRRGFNRVALHRAAVNEARRGLKPEIPLTGSFGIPMRDELQLELPSAEWDDIISNYRWPPA